jgi:cellulose synthase/poly-beta-1,6-N-acetylglucosamine synthase-like glycosyltransferase
MILFIFFIAIVFVGMLFIDILPYFSHHKKARYMDYRPKALVIVPCRGVDASLLGNLKSISSQKYGNYKVVCVVDDGSDTSIPYIKAAGISFITSNFNVSGSRQSGKVNAILAALGKYKEFEVYVIADSDITVSKRWLANLVAPLQDKKIGLSTMFPKFIPKSGLWSKVKFVWGLVGEGMMENKITRFGWGGSMAFRKNLIDIKAMNMLTGSKYSVSDDICLTKITKSKGLSIEYVSEAQPVVYSYDSFSKFIEWSNRQTALSLLGYRRNLYYGGMFYSAEIVLIIFGVVLSATVSPIYLILLLHLVKSEIKTYMRVKRFDPSIALITISIPFIYISNLIMAQNAEYISWRGRRYYITDINLQRQKVKR